MRWLLLAALIAVLLTLDLIVHARGRATSRSANVVWSLVWIAVALAFGGWVMLSIGRESGEEYFAAYLLEKSLSIDNLFIFLVIFERFAIQPSHQRRVLTWGIMGAFVTRGLFIGLGVAVIARWSFVLLFFGGLLILTGLKMLKREPERSGEGRFLGWLRRHMPWTPRLDGEHFLVREGGRWLATPLLVALVAIEATDIVVAVDSVPAAFAVTEDPFIIYSSNILAMLGLRSLFAVIADLLRRLVYLRYGLALVLIAAGAKMLISRWHHIPAWLSLTVILLCVGGAVAASLVAGRRKAVAEAGHP